MLLWLCRLKSSPSIPDIHPRSSDSGSATVGGCQSEHGVECATTDSFLVVILASPSQGLKQWLGRIWRTIESVDLWFRLKQLFNWMLVVIFCALSFTLCSYFLSMDCEEWFSLHIHYCQDKVSFQKVDVFLVYWIHIVMENEMIHI